MGRTAQRELGLGVVAATVLLPTPSIFPVQGNPLDWGWGSSSLSRLEHPFGAFGTLLRT